ncbi:MAG: hypothetical protein ACREDR_18320, partial [Blastocatellia bacterium]
EVEDYLNQRWRAFSEERDRMLSNNYAHFKSQASHAQNVAYNGEPKEAKGLIKEIQGHLKGVRMRKEDFESVLSVLADAWEQASRRQKEAFQERERRREEHDRKRLQWRASMEEHVSRWGETIRKKYNHMDNLRSQIDRLEGMQRDARTSDFADRVRGWLNEKYDKLDEIQRQTRELEDRIRGVESKLADDARRH